MATVLSRSLLPLFLILSQVTVGFNGTIRFSNDFYAAQKYFYAEAKNKFPKITKDKFYPEVPLLGNIKQDELMGIQPLSDVFEARRIFTEEVHKYPEQLYPEIFAFLSNHPALNVSSGNKAKFEALENYFLPFNYLFCSDNHYYFNPEVKTNPCPIVFFNKDDKKNSISFSIHNNTKKNLSFNLNEGLLQGYFTFNGSQPFIVKAGSSSSLKLSVALSKLTSDSVFKPFNFIFSDPTQPKIKIIVSVILLPSKDFLNLPPHFFDLTYSYTTHFKNIDLYTDRTSGPVKCSGNNCSGEVHYTLRSADRSIKSYSFGELGEIQFNLTTQSPHFYSSNSNQLQLTFNELGTIEGKDRNCPGSTTESSAPCPPETANNGKQMYGSRRIDLKIYIPNGNKTYDLNLLLNYIDLKQQFQNNPEVSWLQDKKLLVLLSDDSKTVLTKEFASNSQIKLLKKGLVAGIYTVSILPVNEDSGKLNSSFELNYLNHGGKARFDFSLKSRFVLSVTK